MPVLFKRIHMPKPLYEEIEKSIAKQNSPYKTASELCPEAGRMLTEHYKLREKSPINRTKNEFYKSVSVPAEDYNRIKKWVDSGQSPYVSVDGGHAGLSPHGPG